MLPEGDTSVFAGQAGFSQEVKGGGPLLRALG